MQALRKSANVDGISLQSLVDVAVRTRPDQVFMRAPARRERWAGEEGRDITVREFEQQACRLGALLAMSRLPARARALIMAPLGPEAVTAMLAALHAGYRPFFLPVGASQARLQEWVDGAGPALAVGTSACGELEPARMLRDCAARSFNARLICAFGASPPDGVVPLGPVLASTAPLGEVDPGRGELEALDVTAETSWGERQTFGEAALVDAAVELARLSRMSPHGRILSLMTGVTAASLASGPYLSLLTGAELLPLGVFSLSALWAGLSDGKPVCLVAPEALETALTEAGVAGHQSVSSVVYLHRSLPGRSLRSKAGAPRAIDLAPTPSGWIAVERGA